MKKNKSVLVASTPKKLSRAASDQKLDSLVKNSQRLLGALNKPAHRS
ncbi:hypothetical protein JOC77_002893 [Peribacillus deserti]|uniref:Uncharacterized protein n=1 Tax=Peribacillus deserti TaxID=673318 RepID=A0ABS2QJV3_9BACI|nr:hypothetical protein [Peribacillus deserti]MBM7693453.1 hypothetical protein [Peribacillus deserti]